jgi:hypothetical protein
MKILLPKICSIVLILFLFSNGVNAQKIKYNKGIVTLDGQPYVKLIKKVKYVFVHNNFWIQNLDGKELMSAEVKEKITREWNKENREYEDNTSYYYVIHFKESEAKVTLNQQLSKKGLIKMVLKNKLIKGNQIDPIAERSFISRYGGSIHGIKSTALPVIKEDQIFHYGNLVGNFITQSSTSESGVAQTILLVYNNDGEKVAEAIVHEENAIEWSVYTYSDEKMSFVRYEAEDDREKLFKWISDKKYL